MGNINYSLLKDYVIFTDIDPKVTYYLQSWDGLGFNMGDVTTGTPFGPLYNPSNVIIYNTIAFAFILDEEYKVFETIQNLGIKNAPVDGSVAESITTTIDLHLMSNTYQKEIGYIRMYNAYVNSIMNIQHNYNTSDNTDPKVMQVIFKYQNHQFFRNEE